MCLILVDYLPGHDGYLHLAANRDEWFKRPTERARFWDDAPQILAGRDRAHGGTWLGVSRTGRFAAITNYREPARHDPRAPSRGGLVGDFLGGVMSAQAYAMHLAEETRRHDRHNGYNLLVHDGEALWYFSNRGGVAAPVTPGVHGLSNHLLDTPWPKVVRGREGLAAVREKTRHDRDRHDPVHRDTFFGLLADRTPAPDAALPQSGLPLERERGLSASHILLGNAEQPDTLYGTRSATVLSIEPGHIDFSERTFDSAARIQASMREVFRRRPAQ